MTKSGRKNPETAPTGIFVALGGAWGLWFLLYHRKNDSAHPLRPDPCAAVEASKQRDDLLRST